MTISIVIYRLAQPNYNLLSTICYNLQFYYEQQGDRAKAIEHYDKFLDLWKEVDSGLPEVDDARNRLARLKSQ